MIRRSGFPEPVHRWECADCDAAETSTGTLTYKRAKVGAIEHSDAEEHSVIVTQLRMLVEFVNYGPTPIRCICGHVLASHQPDTTDPYVVERCKTCGCAGFENEDEVRMQNDAEDE